MAPSQTLCQVQPPHLHSNLHQGDPEVLEVFTSRPLAPETPGAHIHSPAFSRRRQQQQLPGWSGHQREYGQGLQQGWGIRGIKAVSVNQSLLSPLKREADPNIQAVQHPEEGPDQDPHQVCLHQQGAAPGAAEQNSADQVEPPPAAESRSEQHRQHVGELHQPPLAAAEHTWSGEAEAAGGAWQQRGAGGGLQK